MKIITYNVNGIRAALRKGFYEWLLATDADVVCLQEIKASEEQFDKKRFEALGYTCFMHTGEKKGYSGVAILTKHKPNHVAYGCGIAQYDCEGRIIRADFDDFSIVSVYMPSGSGSPLRQQFKLQWLEDFLDYCQTLKTMFPNLIISGDFNVCHQPIDLHNPLANKNSSGFLPSERAWMNAFLESGFIDAFRYFNQLPHQYTWWPSGLLARQRNLGWRIDYHMVSSSLEKRLKRTAILPHAAHADHCPVLLEIE